MLALSKKHLIVLYPPCALALLPSVIRAKLDRASGCVDDALPTCGLRISDDGWKTYHELSAEVVQVQPDNAACFVVRFKSAPLAVSKACTGAAGGRRCPCHTCFKHAHSTTPSPDLFQAVPRPVQLCCLVQGTVQGAGARRSCTCTGNQPLFLFLQRPDGTMTWDNNFGRDFAFSYIEA